MKHKLKDYIQKVIKAIDKKDLDVGVTFELELDENCMVTDGGPHKVRFSCKKKKPFEEDQIDCSQYDESIRMAILENNNI